MCHVSVLQLDGQLGQLRAANLIGAVQVAIEDVVGEAGRLAEQQPDADQRVRPVVCATCPPLRRPQACMRRLEARPFMHAG